MTTKRDRLVNAVGELIAHHSREDWLYLAESLDAASRIARECAERAPKKAKARRAKKKPTLRKRYSAKDRVVARLGDILAEAGSGVSADTVKRIAIAIGIKAELPKIRADIEDLILRNIDESPEAIRQDKLEISMKYLEGRERAQSNDYQRWVSLITEKKPS